MQGASVLFSEMTPPAGQEQRFHNWYDEEHIPLRMDVPGFVSAQRYRDLADDAKGFLAVYEMTDPGVMKTPAYQEVKTKPSETTREMLSTVLGFTRYIAAETSVRVDQWVKNKVNPLFWTVTPPSLAPKEIDLKTRFPQLIKILEAPSRPSGKITGPFDRGTPAPQPAQPVKVEPLPPALPLAPERRLWPWIALGLIAAGAGTYAAIHLL